jgi:hypothetical protein
MASSRDIKNPGGRPATGQGAPVLVRIQPRLLAAIDTWIAEQADRIPPEELTRPEAVRRLTAEALIGMGLMEIEDER